MRNGDRRLRVQAGDGFGREARLPTLAKQWLDRGPQVGDRPVAIGVLQRPKGGP